MLKIATAKEMQEIDRLTIEKYGIAGIVLMERAGLSVVRRINEILEQRTQITDNRQQARGQKRLSTVNCQRSTVVVLCGGGNNGGDGFVIARILHNQGRDVEVYLASSPGKLQGDAKTNYHAAKRFGVRIQPFKYFLDRYSPRTAGNCLVIDALLGTGLSREVKKPVSDIIEKVNRLNCPVISVDIPSGISSDNGQMMGCAVRAEHTVTFGLPKRGHMLYPGAECSGKLYVEDIGFPDKLLESDKIRVNLVQQKDVSALLPKRPKYSHKGTYGHVLIIAGSKGKTGAALMAARACLKTGAGLVTIGIPETLLSSFQARVTEEMILPLPDKGNGTIAGRSAGEILGFLTKRATVLAVGPGLSVDNEISGVVYKLLLKTNVPVVIDADGLNAITGRTGVLRKCRAPVILTPHPGEMTRLLKQGTGVKGQGSVATTGLSLHAEVEQDRISTTVLFAKKTKTYIVLKGVPTVTATPEGEAFINSSGNPGMAKAGTGDVLTGMISALLAQGLSPRNASIFGVYMHGYAGDIISKKKGEYSLVASDIINTLPGVFKSIKKKC